MTYDPKNMPTSLEEWNELVDFYTTQSKTKHAAEVAKTKAQAEAAWARLPADENRPTQAEYVAQALSVVEPPKDRAYFESMYACYYPQEQPVFAEAEPTTEQLFAQLRSIREVKLREYDAKISQLERQARLGEDVAAGIAAWDAYALALCNLPEQEGAPWDGGGVNTPWPVMP